jgi:uncharacterized flavoprotein (TIGR03862 family)
MPDQRSSDCAAKQPKVAVVGCGPAGLMVADVLAQGGAKVSLYDAMAAPGRKFLLAGRGGLNLTHSEDFSMFLARYGEAAEHLRPALEAFPPQMLRDFARDLGEPTFVGTSGRVFPKSFKASPLLRAWLRRLDSLGVRLHLRHLWQGWDASGAASFLTPDGTSAINGDALVLALGGASWPRLGSTGGWTRILADEGVRVAPLLPANCGFRVSWSDRFRNRFAGMPIKGAAFSFDGRGLRGEAVVTSSGIEGGAIYALSAPLRDAILRDGKANLEIALRPDLTVAEIAARLKRSTGERKPSLSNLLRKTLKLSPVAIGLLYESQLQTTPLARLAPEELARLINNMSLPLCGIAPIERAISTAGGISFDEIDGNFMLRKKPGVFVAGEMLDWEAPTGGYLLQASFATGAAAGRGALHWLARY